MPKDDREMMRDAYDALGRDIDRIAREREQAPLRPPVPTPVDLAVRYVPTRRERVLRWLGFGRYPITDMPAAAELLPGWSMTHVKVEVSLLDRLRLLVSGRAFIAIEQRYDVQVKQVATVSAIAVRWDWPK